MASTFFLFVKKGFGCYSKYAWWNMNCLSPSIWFQSMWEFIRFLKKTPTNDFPFESFPLGQFLLTVLSVKVKYIRNWCSAWVAYSQGRASDDSRAHLVIEFGPSIYDFFNLLSARLMSIFSVVIPYVYWLSGNKIK